MDVQQIMKEIKEQLRPEYEWRGCSMMRESGLITR
jgi:hypothetical protein